ncbi:hypothetical protein FFR93_38560, partial [Rhizobium sp. MHM7A]
MCRRHHRHPAGDHLRQNLDPLHITLAHRNRSHPQSPRSSNAGRLTFQLCRNRTLQLCVENLHQVQHGRLKGRGSAAFTQMRHE